MQIKSIANTQKSFGKYLTPDDKTQALIEQFFLHVINGKARERLADEYVSLIKEQEQDCDSTISIETNDFKRGGCPTLRLTYESKHGKKTTGKIYEFSELVRSMKEFNAYAKTPAIFKKLGSIISGGKNNDN